MRKVRTDGDTTGFECRQEDVHVNRRDVDHGVHLTAGRQHLAELGDAILNATFARRDEGIVGDVDPGDLDRMLGGGQGQLGLRDTRDSSFESGRRALELLTPLVEQFPRRVAALGKRVGAIPLLLCQFKLGAQLLEDRASLFDCFRRLLGLRFAAFQRRLEILDIHAGDNLSRLDHVALLREKLGYASGKFGVDVDFIGLETPVAPDDADGQLVAHVLPPINATRARRQHDRRKGQCKPPSPFTANARGNRRRRRNDRAPARCWNNG